MEVLIFKTSVERMEDVRLLAPSLNELAGKGKWNFALDDTDHILRIVSGTLCPQLAIQLLSSRGFECAELEDFVPA